MLSAHSIELVDIALTEDLASGDVTTDALIERTVLGRADILAKEDLVVCGQEIARMVFRKIDEDLQYRTIVEDGQKVRPGEKLAVLSGSLSSILKGERTSLNFLQRLSGISTMTSRIVALIPGDGPILLDTRKTTPGLRELEKYAVKIGGGQNHRIGLFDAYLIKNNHLDALSGDFSLAVLRCRKYRAEKLKVEVEVRSIEELRKAIAAQPDAILLDNFSPDEIRKAVAVLTAAGRADTIELEASGGINEKNISHFCVPGLKYISMGALTHSARAVDICLHVV